MHAECFRLDDGARLSEALAIRMKVFVEEQHVPPEVEIDEHDRSDLTAVHAVVRDGKTAIAAGRFYPRPDGTSVQVGRMAVLPTHRNRGAGRVLLHALIDAAKARGYTTVSLSSQTHAREFYEKSGFTAHGEIFEDAGILHQEMSKTIA